MTTTWTNWLSSKDVQWVATSPYVDWFSAAPPEEFEDGVGERVDERLVLTESLSNGAISVIFGSAMALASERSLMGGDPSKKLPPSMGSNFGDPEGFRVPVPGFAYNEHFIDFIGANQTWAPADKDIPKVPADTVIVGVIDSGISLGNSRFRDAEGSTRILAAWQQCGRWKEKKEGDEQPYLPFGSEIYRDQINRKLAHHSVNGFLNEDEFNRDTDTVNMTKIFGHRELAGRYSHGNHVLDIAAGYDPGEEDRIKIIAVNLPNRATINNSGIFLDYFAAYGIGRIADLADLIWQKSVKNPDPNKPKGFPIVINFSFGKNAGSKDGFDYFQTLVDAINNKRAGYLPIKLVIPVGNHNLEQSNAHFNLLPGSQDKITFRTSPEDHSGNYLEVWSEPIPYTGDFDASTAVNPLEIAVAIPGEAQPQKPSAGILFSQMQLGDDSKIARLYCVARTMQHEGRPSYRVGYVLCTAPTCANVRSVETAPAGAWTIILRNASDKTLVAQITAQTDQSILPQSGTGRTPKLEYPGYEKYEPNGRRRDTYAYPYVPGISDLDNSPILRRHGSVNNTAVSKHVIAVAGFRRSDGRPADYSATGFGFDVLKDPHYGDSRCSPSISLVTDDGAAHAGTLAAGASNGSVVAMRGTSFAAAAATRLISQQMKSDFGNDFCVEQWFSQLGKEAELKRGPHSPPAAKIGAGRLETPGLTKVCRMGPGPQM